MRLKISARKSDLARLQAYTVGEALQKTNPEISIDYKFKESLGDKNLTDPLWKIPEKGVFTEDFYGELKRGETDFVVHSWKDLPTELKSDTVIAATLPRADQRDLLLIKKTHFQKLKQSKSLRVFSSSPRREYNLTHFFKTHLPFDLEQVRFESVRGNIPTRIRKLLESQEIDGLVVAKAALDRLLTAPQIEFKDVQVQLRTFLTDLDWTVLPLSVNPNAAAQGALAVEIMAHREDLKKILAKINHPQTFICAQKERTLLASFGGGCHQKIGVAVLARPYGEITLLKGLTDQGKILNQRTLTSNENAPQFSPEALGTLEIETHRTQLSSPQLDTKYNAFLVARKEAWPENSNLNGFVWTAGIKTWQNLAQKGVWVHGCNDGLGEQEDSHIEILAGQKLNWAKLSHKDSAHLAFEGYPVVATYRLEYGPTPSQKNHECFFWHSGSQFLKAVQDHPELLYKHHGCGPGNTFKIIRTQLEKLNIFDPKKLRIYLDQEDWRTQCTR